VRVLAFDTATGATAVALADVPGTLALEARDDPPPGARPGHAQRLLGLIDELLARAGGWEPVKRIAVGVGPGTFTGLRIGITTAHALARARDVPLVGVGTLTALAGAVSVSGLASGSGPTVAVLDARRGELFVAGWVAGADPLRDPPAIEPRVVHPAELAATLAAFGPGPLAVGDGAIKCREMLEREGATVPPDESRLHRVSALAHCVIGAAAPLPAAPEAVRPAYLRVPDAELARRAKAAP
jgi:tRNA threonylcarbamoyl adenosine modification protein YeaZ